MAHGIAQQPTEGQKHTRRRARATGEGERGNKDPPNLPSREESCGIGF